MPCQASKQKISKINHVASKVSKIQEEIQQLQGLFWCSHIGLSADGDDQCVRSARHTNPVRMNYLQSKWLVSREVQLVVHNQMATVFKRQWV